MNRILLGAIAGFTATMPMTMAMRRLQARLPAEDGYGLPPREIVERIGRAAGNAGTGRRAEEAGEDVDERRFLATILAHFAYGAATGALFPALTGRRSLAVGAGYGVAVWAASYLGWIPAARILAPAWSHPGRRNLLMLAAHAVWGGSLVHGLAELERSRAAFSGAEVPDAPGESPAGPALR